MTAQRDLYIRFDWAIKRLLRQKANFGVLEGFLTVFLGQTVQIVEILESEGNQQSEQDKFNRVDIKAKNAQGEIILIEVQNAREADYLERILYGVAKTITEHIDKGQPYRNIAKVYSISILYFDLGKGTDYLYHGQNRFIGVHTKDSLEITRKEKNALVGRKPEEIFPEYILIRVNQFNQVAVTPLEEWMDYLKQGVIRPDTTAPGLREAREKLCYYSMSDQERHAYDAHIDAILIQNDVLSTARREGLYDGRQEGLAEGIEIGRAEGIKEGEANGEKRGRLEEKRSAAQNLKAMGIDPLVISQALSLSIEEINQL
ncbi:MAG: Rpn family recombination-promoting nuclease/putative transposase [Parabacteroides sp.]